MSTYQIADRGDLRKYRTEIPNSIDDMNLSVYAFRLYVHLKRVAGDSGKCWQSTDTLAKSCNMSKGMISKAKDELLEKHLISIEEQKLERGGRAAHHITIADIWLENFIKYSGMQSSSLHEQASSLHEQASSLHEQASSLHEQASSLHEIKKEPIVKKEQVKKERDKSRTPDPRTKHPAIQLVHGVTGHYPPKAIYDIVINRLGEAPDGPKFARVHQTWLARGNKPTNLDGQLDWYEKGIPDYKPASFNSAPKKTRTLKGPNNELIEEEL